MRSVVRTLLAEKVATGVAVLTLSVGIGASTAVFTVISSIVLRPLPVTEPDRLARLHLGAIPRRTPGPIGSGRRSTAAPKACSPGRSRRAASRSRPAPRARTIELERLDDVVYVGRPVFGQEESTVSLFRLDAEGGGAARTRVRLGRASVNTIEVLEGVAPDNEVVLSDMSAWDEFDRVRLD